MNNLAKSVTLDLEQQRCDNNNVIDKMGLNYWGSHKRLCGHGEITGLKQNKS